MMDKVIGIMFLFSVSVLNAQETSFIDPRDDQVYMQIKIGNQLWMGENLNYFTENSYCYNNNDSLCSEFGRLYTWEVAKNVCPDGWHLPSDEEWQQLEMYIGMPQHEVNDLFWRGSNEGEKLKATSTWNQSGGGNDKFHFALLPAGYRGDVDSTFGLLHEFGYSWTSSEFGDNLAWYRRFSYAHKDILRYTNFKTIAYSVRCIKSN